MNCCSIQETLTQQELIVKEYKYWTLCLRNRVKTLGSAALFTNTHYQSMSEIPEEAITELSKITKEYELVFNKLFSPDKYNYQMNMMKENHTHFNIFPRYSTTKQYLGMDWVDMGWPLLPGENIEVDMEKLIHLASILREEFKTL